jgi:hypothetical protein
MLNHPPVAPVPRSVSYQEIDKVHHALEATFLCPWEIYQDSAIDLELTRLSTTLFTEESTEQAQIEVDNKAPANRHQLQELIRKQAQNENKKLGKELNILSYSLIH